jgi:hypothetical protein
MVFGVCGGCVLGVWRRRQLIPDSVMLLLLLLLPLML